MSIFTHLQLQPIDIETDDKPETNLNPDEVIDLTQDNNDDLSGQWDKVLKDLGKDQHQA